MKTLLEQTEKMESQCRQFYRITRNSEQFNEAYKILRNLKETLNYEHLTQLEGDHINACMKELVTIFSE